MHLILDCQGWHFSTVSWAPLEVSEESVPVDCAVRDTGSSSKGAKSSAIGKKKRHPLRPFMISKETRSHHVAVIQKCAKHIRDKQGLSKKARGLHYINLRLWASTLTMPAHRIEAYRAAQVGTIHFRFRYHSMARYNDANMNKSFLDNLPLTGPFLFGPDLSRLLDRMRTTFAFGHGAVYRRYFAVRNHPDISRSHIPIFSRCPWSSPPNLQKQVKERGVVLALPWSSLAVNVPSQETQMDPHIDSRDARWGMCTVVSGGHYSGGALVLHAAGIRLWTRPALDIVSFPSAALMHSNTKVQGYRLSLIGFSGEDVLQRFATVPLLSDYPVWDAELWS